MNPEDLLTTDRFTKAAGPRGPKPAGGSSRGGFGGGQRGGQRGGFGGGQRGGQRGGFNGGQRGGFQGGARTFTKPISKW